MFKDILLLCLLFTSGLFYIYFLCDSKKIKKLFYKYLNSISKIFLFLNKSEVTKIDLLQSNLNEVSSRGLSFIFYLLYFLIPFIVIFLFLANKEIISSKLLSIIFSSSPYLILLIKKNE
tara:strand:- start:783 stop:1139 length:357 start_codon:yes stop_codon:yes gene_type:complete